MSENTSNQSNNPIVPSDLTIPDNYVALKPGNYKQRQDLSPFMGRKMTRKDIDVYLPETPLGVGSARSAVFIYPQGTIEIVGEVYAWNKLVKPGVYSQWEKLRYLNDEIIVPRIENEEDRKRNQYHHHASYNQTLTLNDKRFLRRYPDKDEILEYRYVSFENQILTRDGNDKIYPIPIIDGRLTIYPDGTFKTEGVVVESKKNTVIDKYGYLGDQENYQNEIGFFDNVTKDDVNPFNVYKLISRNDDNSVTYGPIEANERVNSGKPRNLPRGIIPVNDGSVTLYPRGIIQIEGTVLTETGYRIAEGEYNFADLIQGKDENDNLLYNPDYIDRSYIYRPTFTFYTRTLGKDETRNPIGNLYWNSKEVNKTPNNSVKVTEAVYVHRLQYHLQSDRYTVISNENENVTLFTYLPMKGWDSFVAYHPTASDFRFMDDMFHKAGIDLGDRMTYPIVYKQYADKVSGKHVYPKPQLDSHGNLVKYSYVDHTFFLMEYNPLSCAIRDENPDINHEFIKLPEGNVLVPYRNLENTIQGSVRIVRREDILYLETTGHVIWKRFNQYYVLGEGTVKLDTSWPELLEDKEGYTKVFDVDGYFTDEPIFFNKEDRSKEPETIDGIRRQEEGLFKLVKRNVTGYLSYYEKALIDNHRNDVTEPVLDDYGVPKDDISLYALDVEYTAEQSNLCLEYNAWRFNNTVPKFFSPTYVNKKVDGQFTGIGRSDVNFEVRANKITAGSNTNGIYFHTDINNSEKDIIYLIRNQSLSEDGTQLQHVGLDVEVHTHNDHESAIANYVNFDNQSDRDKGIDYRRKVIFPKGWILSDGPIVGTLEGEVEVTNLNGREYYFRTSESFDRYEGQLEKVDPFGKQLTFTPKLVNSSGTVDVWYDDPYYEEASLQRIKLRANRDIDPLVINDKENIDNVTEVITGKGQPGARLTIYGPEGNIIGEAIIDYNGNWSVPVETLIVGQTYRVKQNLEEWDISTEDTFTVKRRRYRYGEDIDASALFGIPKNEVDKKYLRPFNLRNKNNAPNVKNLIDSKITFNEDDQTYTIHGLAIDGTFNLYEEGTYPIGVLPPSYRSQVLENPSEMPSVINTWRKGNKAYAFSQEGWIADNQLTLSNEITSIDIINDRNTFINEKWILSKETREQLSRLDITDEIQRFLLKALLPESNLVREDVTFEMNNSGKVKKLRIGRYQNRVVFDDFLFKQLTDEPTDNRFIHLNVKGTDEGNGYKQEGYTVEELVINTVIDKVWWTDLIDYTEQNNLRYALNEMSNQFIKEVAVANDTSIINPRDYTQYAFSVSPTSLEEADIDNMYSYPGKEGGLTTYTGYNQPYKMKITDLRNWNKVLSAEENVGQSNIIAWGINYYFRLTGNYPVNREEMKPSVLQYWTNKRFSPTMFTFDNTPRNSNAEVIFSKDGKSVTINGSVKIGCRYTVPNQVVTDKSQIQFIKHSYDDYAILLNGDMVSGDISDADGGVYLSGYVFKRVYKEDITQQVTDTCEGPDFEDELPIPYIKSVHTSRRDDANGLPVSQITWKLNNVNDQCIFHTLIDGLIFRLEDKVSIEVDFRGSNVSNPVITFNPTRRISVRAVNRDAGNWDIIAEFTNQNNQLITVLVPRDAKDFNIVNKNNVFRREYNGFDLAFKSQLYKDDFNNRKNYIVDDLEMVGSQPINHDTVIDSSITEDGYVISLPCRIMFYYYQPEELFEDEVGYFYTRQII